MSDWKATVSRAIVFKGVTVREGETLLLTDQQMRDLYGAGVIGAMKRVAPVEMATAAKAPEDASRNYGKRGRST